MPGRPLRRARRDALDAMTDEELQRLAGRVLRNANDSELLGFVVAQSRMDGGDVRSFIAGGRPPMPEVRQRVRDMVAADRDLALAVVHSRPQLLNQLLADQVVTHQSSRTRARVPRETKA